MDFYGSRHKCEHSKYECPYKDCNYHINSTGKYSHIDPDEMPITIFLPRNVDEAKWCNNYLDI